MYCKSMYVNKNLFNHVECDVDIEKKDKDKCTEILKNNNLLGYDKKIPREILEEIFCEKYSDCEEKVWQFNLLWMKTYLEQRGYFVTTRGMHGSIRTLSREEMPFYNERENKKALKAMKCRQKSLYMINPNDMDKEHSKKLEFEQLRNGHLLVDFHEQMSKRCK